MKRVVDKKELILKIVIVIAVIFGILSVFGLIGINDGKISLSPGEESGDIVIGGDVPLDSPVSERMIGVDQIIDKYTR